MGSDAPAARPAQPEEPLAQLGVAPGGGEMNQNKDPASMDADQPVPIAPPPAPVLAN